VAGWGWVVGWLGGPAGGGVGGGGGVVGGGGGGGGGASVEELGEVGFFVALFQKTPAGTS